MLQLKRAFRWKMLLPVGAILAVAAGALLHVYAQQLDARSTGHPRASTTIIKAAKDLPAGALITGDDVVRDMVPTRLLPPDPVTAENFDDVRLHPLRLAVEEGKMLVREDFE